VRVFWLAFTLACLLFAFAYRVPPRWQRKYTGRHRASVTDLMKDDDYSDEPLDDIIRNNQRG
jgi:hypothetical protein